MSPWRGRSPAGWQFTHRGLVSTLPSSANNAAERVAVSLIEAKLSGGASVSCGPPDTACAVTAQVRQVAPATRTASDSANFMLAPSKRIRPARFSLATFRRKNQQDRGFGLSRWAARQLQEQTILFGRVRGRVRLRDAGARERLGDARFDIVDHELELLDLRIELLRLAAEAGATKNGELGAQLLDHQRLGVDLGPEPGDVAAQIVRQAAQIVGIARRIRR